MMTFYQEITLLPDRDGGMPLQVLWEHLYSRIHGALSRGDGDIGISFPAMDSEMIGDKIRVFAPTEEGLTKLGIRGWLSRLSEYSHLSSIRRVPEKIEGYAFFRRVQVKSFPCVARRKARREGITVEKATELLGPSKPLTKLPYIQLKSASSGQRFPLIISRILSDQPVVGAYSTYGLSTTSTVPLF